MTSPFRGSQSGLSRQRLRARRYTRLSRDLYVLHPAEPDLRVQVQALRLVLPDAVPCGRTSALLLNLPVDDDGLLHVARGTAAARSRRAAVQVHRTPVAEDEQHDLKGLPVADGPRTWIDLAAVLHREQLAAVGDVVVRRWSAQELAAAVERRPRRPGLPLARELLPLLDGRAGSPPETRMRLRLHAAGFTALRHGVVVGDASGWLAEPDLADELARVAVQYDGAVHFPVDEQQGRRRREHDVQRDELARQADWEVVVATSRDDRQPHLLVGKVSAAYRRAARRLGSHVLPPHLR